MLQIGADYLYPFPEEYNPDTDSYEISVLTGHGVYLNEESYVPQTSVDSSYVDPTPYNFKDNTSWCNQKVYNYPSGLKDEAYLDPVASLGYTNEFLAEAEIYPFLAIEGNEWMYCISEKLYELEDNEVANSALKEKSYFALQAKLNARVEVDGKFYDI